VKVCVLATSYPRDDNDVAGRFVADAVEGARARGVDVAVVSPASFRHFGIAYGDGIAQNLRARPWTVALLPAFVAEFARAARQAARDADLVHAHWLPSGLAARATGKPFVLQLWGTDVELARRAPALFRPIVRSARRVVVASQALAADAGALGARAVDVVPSGVTVPPEGPPPDEPPHVLYVGRLSPEKGILDFVEGTQGLPRVIVGDGPLRARVPEAVGFVPPSQLAAWYDRAAVVCVPSRREGYGMTAREAMAHGRALVSTTVGGLADAFLDGATGVAIPPGDPAVLRRAVERLLGDASERDRLGAAARAHASSAFSRDAEAQGLVRCWEHALA
jgi:glycosyltransferase involved in cell wall biosynthesis